jgi:hypothetical protein
MYSSSGAPVVHTAPWRRGITVERAMQSSDMSFVSAWSPKLHGDALLIAEGVPKTTDGNLGATYWLLCIDGKPANSGMTLQRVPSWKTKVEWFWTSKFECKAQ